MKTLLWAHSRTDRPSGASSRAVAGRKLGLQGRELSGASMPSKRSGGMVFGMATRKLTITLEADQLDRIRTLFEAGEAPSCLLYTSRCV